jgi:hypothetical protein
MNGEGMCNERKKIERKGKKKENNGREGTGGKERDLKDMRRR